MTTTYNASIETAEGIKPHGYHLGTHYGMARKCAIDLLRRPGVRTVALYHGSAIKGFGGRLVEIYDHRDLPEAVDIFNEGE